MFVVTKLIAWLLEPLNWYLLLCVTALVALYYKKKRLVVGCLTAVVVCFVVIGFTQLASSLLGIYENAYHKPTNINNLQGVVVLGGGIDPLISQTHNEIALTNGSERLFALARFAKKYPNAQLVYTGGSGYLLHQQTKEAYHVHQFLDQLGITDTQLLLETDSRTTYENARNSKALLAQKDITTSGTWLLVTSAFHMRRAIRTFARFGMHMTAYPVDYRTANRFHWNRPLENHKLMSVFLHEIFGTIAYTFYDYSSANSLIRP